MRAETLKGHLDGILLAVLEPGPRHGYAIMEALRLRSDGQVDLPTGTVYPALHRLERAGLIEATWSQAGGRKRRVYQLTPAGHRALATERSTWRDFSAAVNALLQPAPREQLMGAFATAQETAIDRYLAEVAGRLPGPRRAHTAIVTELRSGLLDTVDAYRSAGLSQTKAARQAVAEFGDPAEVAAAFRPEIAANQARRVVIFLLVTGPPVGLLWIATALASHLGIRFIPPWHWTGLPPALAGGLCLVAVTIGVTAWGAFIGIAATGRLTRWFATRPRQAPTAAAIAGFGAVGADALGLALLAAELAIAPGRLSPLLAGTAAAASVARIVLARGAARQCLALRAVLA